MRLLIVGVGAIGSLIGNRLARAGNEVTLVGRERHVKAIRRRGLGLDERGRVRWERSVQAVTSVEEVADDSFDLIILAVKAYDTATAVSQVTPLTERGIPALLLQNGVGGEEVVAEVLGGATILSAVITLSVEVKEPGLVRLTTTRGGMSLAPTAPGQSVAEFARVFHRAGFRVATYPDYRAMKWSKLLLNIIGNASSAILDISSADVFADRRLFALERKAFREAVEVMHSLGLKPVPLPGYPVPLFARAICGLPRFLLQPLFRKVIVGGRGGKMPSLHMDLARGKGKSEVEYLNGAVVRYAQRLELDVPANRALHSVLMRIVRGEIPWEEYRGRPEGLLAAAGLA
ncbi:MAG: 2-dehydropantoate 2-reductase [Chloroflexota bacterium]|nr:2-dehydropantoate 2-reductase [Chloroflexota bacterium]